MSDVPLSVLDLVPVSAGATHAAALRNAVDLARQTEAFGYQRYWFAEHHLAGGVIGSSTAVAIALVGGATTTRVPGWSPFPRRRRPSRGSGPTRSGRWSPTG
ncbi:MULTISPECIES: LLM class flavin-dependent oxidoreductase [Parafrankia]|uniref:LLM class flavin-dependent oxidoreductase n=1 Tax=Parafrankia TaxID=2994362 RepID=UPI001D01F503|nr:MULTISPECIES: LLM class flavin-dependent oxidoreductase [Parafrankia]